jgi:hypothetical protein
MPCPGCWPWNLPLTVTPAGAPATILLRYEQQLLYRLHVEHHQRTADGVPTWPGELDPRAETARLVSCTLLH